MTDIFNDLNKVDLSDRVKQKMGLSYLSWAFAWSELRKRCPDAKYTIYSRNVHTKTTKTQIDYGFPSTTTVVEKDAEGKEIRRVETSTPSTITTVIENETDNEVYYFTDGLTCFVKVGVTVNGVEYVEQLPIMDMRNQSIPVGSVKSTDVNRAIQRAFVKAVARHGLGLYIYAGEDVPTTDPVVIDYNAAKKAANDIKAVPAEIKAEFEAHKQIVTGLILELQKKVDGKEVLNYANEVLPQQKIGNVTSDKFLELYRLEVFLNNLKAQLGE